MNLTTNIVACQLRDPAKLTLPGVEVLQLGVTNPKEIAATAELAMDVTLAINNTGIAEPGGFLTPASDEIARRILETNFFGVLNMSRDFAPVLKSNGPVYLSASQWRSQSLSNKQSNQILR